MNLEKQKPFRSRTLLDAASGQACVLCESVGTTVAAHYSGRYAHLLGKGTGIKASDVCTAHLCVDCHRDLDSYCHPNDDTRSIRFFLAIFETQRRLLDRGVIKIG